MSSDNNNHQGGRFPHLPRLLMSLSEPRITIRYAHDPEHNFTYDLVASGTHTIVVRDQRGRVREIQKGQIIEVLEPEKGLIDRIMAENRQGGRDRPKKEKARG